MNDDDYLYINDLRPLDLEASASRCLEAIINKDPYAPEKPKEGNPFIDIWDINN